MLTNDCRKFGKITSKEKEMSSKKTKKNYKRDLIQYLNHQAQHKKRKVKTQAVIVQTIMGDMINLITSSQKTSSAITIKLTKKEFIAKNH